MKNFKLLLATTAILSMGAIMAYATSSNISGDAVEFQASVKFLEPVSITQTQALHFGTLLHPTAGQKVYMVPQQDDTAPCCGSDAVQAFTTGNQAPKMGRMTYSGPNMTLTGQEYFQLFFSSTESGTQADGATISLTNGDKTCGSVHFDGTTIKMVGASGEIKTIQNDSTYLIGGLFTVDANYDNTISYGECTGSVYVTLVIDNI